MASGWGAALSSFGQGGLDILERKRLQEEEEQRQAEEKAERDRQFNLLMQQFLMNKSQAAEASAFRTRQQLGPGDVPENVGAQLAPYGLAEGTLSSTQFSPGTPSTSPFEGMQQKDFKGKFTIPANYLEQEQMAEHQRTKTTFDQAQADRARIEATRSQLPPHLQTFVDVGVDPTMPTWRQQQEMLHKQALELAAAQRSSNPQLAAMVQVLDALKPRYDDTTGELLPGQDLTAYNNILEQILRVLGVQLPAQPQGDSLADLPAMTGPQEPPGPGMLQRFMGMFSGGGRTMEETRPVGPDPDIDPRVREFLESLRKFDTSPNIPGSPNYRRR